jgi:hypothetical protein
MSMDRDHPCEAGLGKNAANFVPCRRWAFSDGFLATFDRRAR